MVLAVFAICERVRLATGAVSIGVLTRGGTRSMVGMWDRVRHAMGSSRLCGIGMSGGFGMTTLGSGMGGLSLRGRCIGRRMERVRS